MEQIKSLEEIQNFKGKYPKQLWSLFFSEMWERFCFYGLRGMLTVFMVTELMMGDKQANLQYGATQAWVYAFTFIGGMMADKILGFKKSLFWGGLLMIAGSIILMVNPQLNFFYGIGFLIVGTGFFKPNISSMVGQLYKNDDTRRDAGFSLFYAGINLGAFLGGILMIGVAQGEILEKYIPIEKRWNFAFGLVAVAMIISLVVYFVTNKNLGPIGSSPLKSVVDNDGKVESNKKWYEYAVYLGTLICVPLIIKMVSNTVYTDYFMYIIGPFSLIYLIFEMTKLGAAENKKLIAAFIFILFSVVFWAIFEQAGGSLSLFAKDNLEGKLVGFNPNQINNSANSLFVIAFAPLLGLIWIWMANRKIEPNGVVKFGLGFLFLGLCFFIFSWLRTTDNGFGKASLAIFTFGYFVVTIGEICLSPIGLSLMTKLATPKLQGFMMGMWFLASAYGQYVAGLFGASISPNENATPSEKLIAYCTGYNQFAWYAIIAGILIIAISPFVKKLMQDVK
jgi:POT family proton-dependent oligopeptide transporter